MYERDKFSPHCLLQRHRQCRAHCQKHGGEYKLYFYRFILYKDFGFIFESLSICSQSVNITRSSLVLCLGCYSRKIHSQHLRPLCSYSFSALPQLFFKADKLHTLNVIENTGNNSLFAIPKLFIERTCGGILCICIQA